MPSDWGPATTLWALQNGVQLKMFVLLFRDKDQNKGKLIGLQTLPFEQRLLRVYKAEIGKSDTNNIAPPFSFAIAPPFSFALGYLQGSKDRMTKI